MQRRAQLVADHAEEGVLGDARLARRARRLMFGGERRALLLDEPRASIAVEQKQQGRRRRQQPEHDAAIDQIAALGFEIAHDRLAFRDVHQSPAARQFRHDRLVLPHHADYAQGALTVRAELVDIGLDRIERGLQLAQDFLLPVVLRFAADT